MSLPRLLWWMLALLGARAQDGNCDFHPFFIYMSGTIVTASLVNCPADIFSLAVADNETGILPLSDCTGRNQSEDWHLQVLNQENVSRVTISLTRNLQLCASNLTNCCTEALCVLQALQVSACQGSEMVARLLIQAEIYANTSSGNITGKAEENATVIPNQVFQPLGSCPCNLTAGACDVGCCCDLECTSESKQLFEGSCFNGVFGGNVSPPFDHLCSVNADCAPDWFPFLCVQSSLSNSPFLGYFYDGSVSSQQVASFKFLLQTVSRKLSNGYRQGDPILTMHNKYFIVPQPFIAGQCARNAPVAFLQNFEAECVAPCKEARSAPSHLAINSGSGDNIKPEVAYEYKRSDVSGCFGKECRNVTFAEEVIITWEGRRITALKIKILSGEICPEEMVTQKFVVKFVSENVTTMEELSGNPGYQVGKPVRASNLNSTDPVTSLKLWKPDDKSLCSVANLTPLLFGFNAFSGCLMEVSLTDSCAQLREEVAGRLNSLVQVSHVGKRGNSRGGVPDDWVEIIRVDAVVSDTNTSAGSLTGICPDVPAHLNIQIITADVGKIEGVAQEEILGVQTSFSVVTWQVPCPLICEGTASFLPISAAVQFIKVPAHPPVPKTRFQINYTEYDCRRNDVCWPKLFYPVTHYYTGEPYPHTLAKGLVLAFFLLLAILLSYPWNRTHSLWKRN